MSPHSDSNPDKVSGFGWPQGLESGIPTIIPTMCRDSMIGYRRETQIATCDRRRHLKDAEELATEKT